MKFDITTFPGDLKTAADMGRKIEQHGFDGLWTAETAHNPFLPLTLIATSTSHMTLGTQIAVAFPRSPMVTANLAWDLQAQSDGRFALGLGTQVRAHIKYRFGMSWEAPIARLREYIESLRAIWNTWQTGERLRYRGKHYTFTLMTPFFNPGPISHPDIPIYIAGVNEQICRLAGELCQGLHAHAFHTARYLREQVIPNIEAGLLRCQRSRSDFELVVPIFVVTGRSDKEFEKSVVETKSHIAFYASTPTYKAVMDLHGWSEVREKLSQLARDGKWNEMWQHISDEMLHEIAIVAPPDELAGRVKERYAGIADRICFGWNVEDPAGDCLLEAVSGKLV